MFDRQAVRLALQPHSTIDVEVDEAPKKVLVLVAQVLVDLPKT